MSNAATEQKPGINNIIFRFNMYCGGQRPLPAYDSFICL